MAIFDFFKKDKKVNTVLEEENEVKIQEDAVIEYTDTDEGTDKAVSEEVDRGENIFDQADEKVEKLKTEKIFEVEVEAESNMEDNIEANIEYKMEAIIEPEIEDEIKIEPETEPESESEPEKKEKVNFFKKMISGLDKTRKNIMSGVENVLKSFTKIDEELFEELEEVLIMADIGAETSVAIMEAVRARVKAEKITDVADVKALLVDEITRILEEGNDEFVLKSPSIILIIGVNGVGKTTTIGKLAHNYKEDGKKVLLAAADTFRAAAIDQLEIWGERSGIDTIKHQENSDPGAVIFDAVQAAKARKVDILLCDTAGRLHNKKNLMEELRKIFKIVSQNYDEAQLEVLLVLDSTTGQNALQQAKVFKEVANITGIVLTKLDGTAKGGIVIAIKNELKIPVRFIGVGEGVHDLQPFHAKDFAKALFTE